MKKIHSFKALALLVSCFLLLTAFVPKGTMLRLNLPVGEKIKMTQTMNMNYFSDAQLSEKVMSMKLTLDNNYTVTNKSKDGIHTIEFTISKVVMNQSMSGMEMTYDSSVPDDSNPMYQAINQQFGGLINKVFTAKVNNKGEIVESPAGSGGQVSPTQLIENMFIDFPDKKLKIGDTWKQENSNTTSGVTATMNSQFSIKDITKKDVVIKQKLLPGTSIEGEAIENADFDIQQSSEMVIDKKTGKTKSGKINATIKVEDPNMGEMFIITKTTISEVN